jgi:hypothetical protein
MLVADLSNRIRKITPDGVITTVAGSGIAGFAGDGGPATDAQLNHPTGVAVDAAGGILIADQGAQRLRRVDPAGVIHTIAGNGLMATSGDGGPASAATLNNPTSLLVERSRRILIAEGTRVRSIERDGTINTIAGGGTSAPADGLLATSAALSSPTSMAMDRKGGVIVATTWSNQLWTLGS